MEGKATLSLKTRVVKSIILSKEMVISRGLVEKKKIFAEMVNIRGNRIKNEGKIKFL